MQRMKLVDVIHNTHPYPLYNSEMFRRWNYNPKGAKCYYGRRWFRCYDMVVLAS